MGTTYCDKCHFEWQISEDDIQTIEFDEKTGTKIADALNRDVIKKNKMRSKLFVRKDLESVKLPEIFSTKRMHFKWMKIPINTSSF